MGKDLNLGIKRDLDKGEFVGLRIPPLPHWGYRSLWEGRRENFEL